MRRDSKHLRLANINLIYLAQHFSYACNLGLSYVLTVYPGRHSFCTIIVLDVGVETSGLVSKLYTLLLNSFCGPLPSGVRKRYWPLRWWNLLVYHWDNLVSTSKYPNHKLIYILYLTLRKHPEKTFSGLIVVAVWYFVLLWWPFQDKNYWLQKSDLTIIFVWTFTAYCHNISIIPAKIKLS